MSKRFLSLTILSFALLLLRLNAAHAEQVINVAIASSPQSLNVSGRDIKLFAAGDKPAATADTYIVSLKARQLQINGTRFDAPVRLISSNVITVNKKRFRGEIDVVVDEVDGSQVINFVHPLPIEIYVAGIVASEIPSGWPIEALKAQAIASRTYAVLQKYRRIDKSYHLDSSVLDQVYGGLDKEHFRAQQAAQDTFGLVLTYDAKPIQAFFSASCGGQTASSLEGWGFASPFLPGSKCGFCDKGHSNNWKYRVSKTDFERSLSDLKIKSLKKVTIEGHTGSGRVPKVELNFGKKDKKEISVAELRKRLGYNNLRSTVIDKIEMTSKDLIFYGRGHGHGVGMCQWGTRGMAEAGLVASDILARYYPGTQLRRLY